MDVTRTALTLALVAVIVVIGGALTDMRSWPLPLSVLVVAGLAGLAALTLDKVEARSAIAARERAHRRDQNAAAHAARLDDIERGVEQ